jgi:uncharacterized protein
MTVEDARPSWFLRILRRHPLVRMVLEFGGVIGVVVAVQLAFKPLVQGSGGALGRAASAVAVVAAGSAAYVGLVRLFERRPVSELSLRGAPAELALGMACGAGLFSAVIAVLWVLGCYSVAAAGTWAAAGLAVGMSATSGVVEEILFRGVVFRNVEDLFGTWVALTASAVLFGLIHISNPHASLWAATAIAIEAGVLLAAGFILTRRLWLVMGLHFAWNFTQGGIFGVPVSGAGSGAGVLVGRLSCSPLLSGGEFGVEASVFAVAICLAAGVAFAWRALALGRFLPPRWRR